MIGTYRHNSPGAEQTLFAKGATVTIVIEDLAYFDPAWPGATQHLLNVAAEAIDETMQRIDHGCY